MSARIVLNLADGPADCAIDHGPDGERWLSLRQGPALVIVKLAAPSLEGLQQVLAKELGMPAGLGEAAAPASAPDPAPKAGPGQAGG